MAMLQQTLRERLESARTAGLRRELRPLDCGVGRLVRIGSQEFLNFASNDYLGLARHDRVAEAAARASRDFGGGSGASRLISGSLTLQHSLEEALADWHRAEAALVFGSGYAVATGLIPALVGQGDVVILDKRVHACCVDGARLSGAKLRIFRHNDVQDLERVLEWTRSQRDLNRCANVLVITESVFSMDGDLCPLREIVELKDRYGAWLWLDEAHAHGVLGRTGAGLSELLGLKDRVDICMGTLGKALGSSGGYIAGTRELINFAINFARSFIFSTAPTPASTAAAAAALAIVRSSEGESLRSRLRLNADRVARVTGNPRETPTPIVPLILGGEDRAVAVAAALREAGFWIPAIRFPTVARRSARLRLSVSAAHTEEDVERLSAGLPSILEAFPQT